MCSENIPINRPMFKEKAQEFAEQLNLEDLHASNGWLEKLKKKYTYLLLSIYFIKQLYNSVENFPYKTLIYFSSAKNNKRQGTFIPKPSPPFMAFLSTFITHECFLFAFKKQNILFCKFPRFCQWKMSKYTLITSLNSNCIFMRQIICFLSTS